MWRTTIEVGGERYWGDGWGWARADAAARDMGIGRIATGLRGKEGVMDIGRIVAGLRAGAGETEGAPQEQPDKCGRCGGELEPGGRCVNPKCPLSQRADPAFWPWRQSPPTASRRPARRVAALEWHRDEVLRMICRALRESARHDTANGISGAEMGTGVDGQAQIALTTGAGENMQTWMLDAESILEKDSGSDVE